MRQAEERDEGIVDSTIALFLGTILFYTMFVVGRRVSDFVTQLFDLDSPSVPAVLVIVCWGLVVLLVRSWIRQRQ